MQDDAGRLMAGRYRLRHPVGDGGMGVVWCAVDDRLDRVVAVKRLRLAAGLAPSEAERARQRVLREARIAGRLQHPNAIGVYDVADDAGQPVLVMEYLPSHSLAAVLAEHGVLPPLQVAGIGARVASALAAAHAAGIVHRDVKPGNILLGENGATKITDFGISHATGDVRVTSTGLLAGTPAFLSPEAARGDAPGPASDVFSLGATLYAAVEGAPPFGEYDNPIAQLHRAAAGQAPLPHRAGPLTTSLLQMLHDDPAARPAMTQVAADLAAVAGGQPPPTAVGSSTTVIPDSARVGAPISASPAGTLLDLQPATDTARRVRRRPTYLLLAVLAAGILAVLAATVLTAPRSHSDGGAAPPAPTTPNASRSTGHPPTNNPALLQQAVSEYYALLPDNTDQAWTRLGPALQGEGRQQYEKFWHGVKQLHVLTPPRASADTVTLKIAYTTDNGDQIQQTHRLGMLLRDGMPLINSDEVLSSQTAKPSKRGTGGHRHGGGAGHGNGQGGD